jgi:putative NIF3 family GTP cyclohydrolase 1 type 2
MALELTEIVPLVRAATIDDAELGAGRVGNITGGMPLTKLVERLRAAIPIRSLRVVGGDEQSVSRVSVACGAGSSLFDAALTAGSDCFLTGEAGFHTCLMAEAAGLAMILIGHFASERFALDVLAEYLAQQLPEVEVWASCDEQDPLRQLEPHRT